MAVRRDGARAKALQMNRAELGLGLHARHGALIAGELGLVEASLHIAIHGIEGRCLDAKIELVAAGGIKPARRTIAIDGVIGLGVNRAHQGLVIRLLGAVISDGQQEFAQHPALGIECGAGVTAKVAREIARALHGIGNGPRADAAFGKTNQRPFDIARLDPAFERLGAMLLAIGEGEIEADGARSHGRRKLDQRHAILALDHPMRRIAAKPRERARLGRGDGIGAFVRAGDGDIARQTGMNRAAIAIKNAHRDHRARAAIGDQLRLLADQPRLEGHVVEMHRARDMGGKAAIKVMHKGRKLGRLAIERHTAPDADRIAPIGRNLDVVAGQLGDGLAIGEEVNRLARAMADDHTHSGRARVVIKAGEQKIDRAIAHRQPVGIGASGVLLLAHGRVLDGVLGGVLGGVLCVLGGALGRGNGRCGHWQFGAEIGNHDAAALPQDKAAGRAVGGARAAAAVHETAAFGQG